MVIINILLAEVDEFNFDRWKIYIKNGEVLKIPKNIELDDRYMNKPEKYLECRIYRWGARFYD